MLVAGVGARQNVFYCKGEWQIAILRACKYAAVRHCRQFPYVEIYALAPCHDFVGFRSGGFAHQLPAFIFGDQDALHKANEVTVTEAFWALLWAADFKESGPIVPMHVTDVVVQYKMRVVLINEATTPLIVPAKQVLCVDFIGAPLFFIFVLNAVAFSKGAKQVALGKHGRRGADHQGQDQSYPFHAGLQFSDGLGAAA